MGHQACVWLPYINVWYKRSSQCPNKSGLFGLVAAVMAPGYGDLYWSTCVSCAEALITGMQRRLSLEASVSCVPLICDSFSPRSLASLMCTNRYIRQVCEEARVWGWAIVRLHDKSHHLPKYGSSTTIRLTYFGR
jgi:hypothetical protein